METTSLLNHGADQTERSIYKRLPSLWSAVWMGTIAFNQSNERARTVSHQEPIKFDGLLFSLMRTDGSYIELQQFTVTTKTRTQSPHIYPCKGIWKGNLTRVKALGRERELNSRFSSFLPFKAPRTHLNPSINHSAYREATGYESGIQRDRTLTREVSYPVPFLISFIASLYKSLCTS